MKNRRRITPPHAALQRSTEADSRTPTTKPTQEHDLQYKTLLQRCSYACYTYLTSVRGPQCLGRLLTAEVLKL
ncbi:Hypothetical predicted protein [Pelobates cultripes]|uniref:Uncharacterized protein n=1 Tax=Pelobates cultripes TaxID=61616 RepID=A0AAD1RS72_PELCU|nr:Hypothetical predicted protein [Pelobates cultripes]